MSVVLASKAALDEFIAQASTSVVEYLYLTCENETNTLASVARHMINNNIEHTVNFEASQVNLGKSSIVVIPPHLAGMFRRQEFDKIILEVDVVIK
jgi:hypothetical protein